MTKRIERRVVLLLAAALVAGCGYNLVGRGSNVPEDIRSIYVEPMTNATARPQVEQILTRALSDELVTRRRFSIANDAAAADAVLRGTVTSFAVRPLTFDQNGLADNFEIVINADMRFLRAPATGEDDDEVIWTNSRYVFREDYPLEADDVFFDRENQAIEESAPLFAEAVITDLLEGF